MLSSCSEGRVRVYLDFLGCRLNEAELSSWRRQLTAQGHQLTEQANDAHVIALNTCAVTSEAAKVSEATPAAPQTEPQGLNGRHRVLRDLISRICSRRCLV